MAWHARQRGLRVRYLKDRLARISPEDFKNSVAKGAIVAMKLRNMAMGMTVSWDQQLMHRLPFDIVHVTLGKVGDRVLYHEGELYADLLPRTIEIKPDPRRPRDRYGRTLAWVILDGRDLGDSLVAARLARFWDGRRRSWC